MIINLCGKSGSGKGFVSNTLMDLDKNIIYLDIDKVGHLVNEKQEVKTALTLNFGQGIFENGIINRKLLGKIVFSSKEKMKLLEDITWRYMEDNIDDFISNNREKIILLDWILLPQTKYFTEDSIKILVDAPIDVRMKRAVVRDGITPDQFMLRDSASPKYSDQDFNYVINNINQKRTKKVVKKIYEKSIISR